MASQISEINIKLNFLGDENLEKLKSSFRELGKAAKLSEADLNQTQRELQNFAKQIGNTEATTKGLIEAFKGLKTQAEIGGQAYNNLEEEIKRLKGELRGASDQLMRQREEFVKSASQARISSGEVKNYLDKLKQLQSQTRTNSEAFDLFGRDIENLTTKVRELQRTELQNLGKGIVSGTRSGLAGATNAFGEVKKGINETIALFQRLGEQSKTALGKVARTSEGLAAIWAGGKIAGVGAGTLGGISSLIGGGGNLLAGLKSGLEGSKFGIGKPFAELIPQGTIERLQELGSQLQHQQEQVAGLDRMMDGLSQTFTAFGPTGTTAMVGVSVAIAAVYDQLRKKADQTRVELEKSFKGVSNEVQTLLENLSRLGAELNRLSMSRIGDLLGNARTRFNMAPAGSPFSRAMASQIAGLEAMQRSEGAAQAEVLEEYRGRVRGTSQSAQALGERLEYVQSRMKVVDQTTAEGSAEFARLSRESGELQDKLNKLANSYRHVSDMQREASRSLQQPLTKYDPAGKEVITPAGEEFLKNVEAMTAPYRDALDQAEAIYREHRQQLLEIQGQFNQLDIQKADEAHKRQLQANQKQFDAELAQFDAALKKRDAVLQKSNLIQNKLGLGGRELSSFYQQIVGLGTGRERAAQQGMGKTPAQIAADIEMSSRASAITQPSLRKSGVDIGAAIGEGITEGATAKAASQSAAKSLAEQLITAYKRAFRIQSPSGESRDKVGVPIGQGIAEGILEGLNSVKGKIIGGIRGLMGDVKDAGKAAAKPVGGYAFPMDGMLGGGGWKGGGNGRDWGPGSGEVPPPVRSVDAFSNKSIAELQELRSTWEEFRRTQLIPTDADFKRLEKTATTSINQIDKELNRRVGQRRQPITTGQVVQAAGAALSGGIFGGPEGFLGGVGGAIVGSIVPGVGTVGGAFAGAAAGAQASMLRQSIGSTADYAATIDKLKISLKGVAGSQAEYENALRASREVTLQLNVPQEESIRNITRLTAAVKGAGGPVSDAELTFKNVTAAIKATGGSTEDVNAAILAMTQVFSKGKVSAEELSGQLGERLPGAVTKFAEANKMSLPELQKALQNGQVGLNELMKFIRKLGDDYGGTADKIAKSSQEAGARLTVAFDDMRAAVGRALQPVGAELQDAFAGFIRETTPALVDSAKAIGGAIKFIHDNAAVIGPIIKLGIELLVVTTAMKGLRAAMAAVTALDLAASLRGTAAAATITGDVMATSAAQTNLFAAAATRLFGVLGKLAALGVITVGVEYIQKVVKDANDVKDLQDRQNRGGAAAAFEGASREAVIKAQAAQKKELEKLKQQWVKNQADLARNSWLYQIPVLNAILATQQTPDQKKIDLRAQFAQGVLGLDPKKFKTEAEQMKELFKGYPELNGKDGKSAADKAAKLAEQLASEQQKLNESIAQQQIRLAEEVFRRQTEYDRRRYELQKEYADLVAKNQIDALPAAQRDIANSFNELLKNLRAIDDRVVDRGRDVMAQMKTLESAQAMQSVTAGNKISGFYRQGGIGPNGPNTYGPHFDIKKSDGGYFSRNSLDQFVEVLVNGARKSLSQGTTVKGGEFGASRSYGGHAGWDYAFGAGAQLILKNGAQFVSSTKSSYGDATAFMTPDGKVYKILHGNFVPSTTIGDASVPVGPKGKPQTGVAAQQRRNVTDTGDVGVAQVGVQGANAMLGLEAQAAPPLKAAEIEGWITRQTQALRDQNDAMKQSNDLEAYKRELQGQLVSPELLDYRMKLKQVEVDQTQAGDAYLRLIQQYPQFEGQIRQAMDETNKQFERRKQLLAENYDAQNKVNNSVGQGFINGANQYVQSLGTMNEAVANLTQQGFKGLEDALYDLVTTGTTNFQAFAAAILRETARMIIQQLVMKSIIKMIGNIFGFGFSNGGVFEGVANNLIASPLAMNALGGVYGPGGPEDKGSEEKAPLGNFQAFAGGGVFDSPTLFKFANGGTPSLGVLGEAGPEAIMPLRRLPSGRLGVESAGRGGGGGGEMVNNITVNVDAGGSQVQGNQGKSEQLARAVSQAVQDELIKQKRPGGILSGNSNYPNG